MYLGGLSKDYNENNRKDTGLYGNVYDFSIDYSAIKNDKIQDIHNYLMKKNNIVENVWGYKEDICCKNDISSIKYKFFRMCFSEQSRVQSKKGNNEC